MRNVPNKIWAAWTFNLEPQPCDDSLRETASKKDNRILKVEVDQKFDWVLPPPGDDES